MNFSKIIIIFSITFASVLCISVPLDKYHKLIASKCFNETGGSISEHGCPANYTIENLISVIKKIELKLPKLNAKQITVLILRRFHLDGLVLRDGLNIPSQTAMKHNIITEEIMKFSNESIANFPEEALTENEKCGLFFTLSHTINSTIILSQKPIEEGGAGFRNEKKMAIAVNRVLLGAAVGLIAPAVKTTRQLISAISRVDTKNIPDGQVDPLFAVTLSDLLGIDSGSGLTTPRNKAIYGADGEWNSTTCQFKYVLTSNGTQATLAELRGGLDGFNIGRKVHSIFNENPNITLSQIISEYYSVEGLTRSTGVCIRGYGLVEEIQNKLKAEAENYIRVWNGVFYDGSYFDNQLTGYISEVWPQFYQYLDKAGVSRSDAEREFCNPPITSGY